MKKTDRIIVLGSRGMVGSAVVRRLESLGYENIVTVSREDVDLLNERRVLNFMLSYVGEPMHVVMCAAKVGGIKANHENPIPFIADNLSIELNTIRAANAARADTFCFLGSSCVYPKMVGSHKTLEPSDLLTDSLEPTNQWYAVAKIAGIKLCEAYNLSHGDDYFSVMPCNLYGPGDNYDLESSHVIPALIRKFHEAKAKGLPEVEVWGDGKPQREFLHVDDAASGIVRLIELGKDRGGSLINLGSNRDCTIDELARTIRSVVDFKGEIRYVGPDSLNGTPRKLMKTLPIEGWEPQFLNLKSGIRNAYSSYLETLDG